MIKARVCQAYTILHTTHFDFTCFLVLQANDLKRSDKKPKLLKFCSKKKRRQEKAMASWSSIIVNKTV